MKRILLILLLISMVTFFSTAAISWNPRTGNLDLSLGLGRVSTAIAAAWGTITGTLSNQTDIKSAIAGKAQSALIFVGSGGDYADLPSAVTAIKNLSSGATCGTGRIIILPGTYNLTDTLKIYYPITVEGAGPGITNLVYNHNNTGVLISNGEIWQAGTTYAIGDCVITATPNASTVRFRCTSITTGVSGGSEPTWDKTVGNTTIDGGVTWTTDNFITPGVSGFSQTISATATGDGIHIGLGSQRGYVRNIYTTGGNSAVYGLSLDSAMQYDITDYRQTGNSNGILWWNGNPTVFPYSVGDSKIDKVNISLASTNTYGLKFIGPSTITSVVNNIQVGQCEVTGSGTLTSWQVGVWLQNSCRMKFEHLDIENINYGIVEIGGIGTGQLSMDNQISKYSFIPGGSQTEAKAYIRGAPLQVQHNTGTATFVIRSGWVTPLSLAEGGSVILTMDGLGPYPRTIATGGVAADTPSAGLTTVTITANFNLDMPTTRNAMLGIGSALPVRTSYWGLGTQSGGILLPGPKPGIGFQATTTGVEGATFDNVWLQNSTEGTLQINRDKTSTAGAAIGGIRFSSAPASDRPTANTQSISPDKAGEVLKLGLGTASSAAQLGTVRYSAVVAKTTTYLATQNDEIITVSAASPWALTLPAANVSCGKHYFIKKTDDNANVITVTGNASENIDNANTYAGLSAQYKYLWIVCDGTQWWILGSN